MSRDGSETKEELTRQLLNYIKLSRRPDLSTGARAVLQLQIAYTEDQLKKHYNV